ncbi:hypothetical protein Bca52824_012299 [Brassica carinata]|uniref:Uncharacterized protein n=1 Tax=Brassica carinata TaxID=52824 RepID=A0A8X7VWL2_BRACI|nr:hypothetical protein Bca52824_012299 [Brassica carinata]
MKTSSTIHKDEHEDMVSSLTNTDLLHEKHVRLIPDILLCGGKHLVDKITRLVEEDYVSSVNELYARLDEFKEVQHFEIRDRVELIFECDRFNYPVEHCVLQTILNVL